MSIDTIVLVILSILAIMSLSYFYYAKHLSRFETQTAFGLHIFYWVLLNALSLFVNFAPANLIFGIFYKPKIGQTDGMYVMTSMLLYIPFINTILLLICTPLLLMLRNRKKAAL